MQGGKAAFDFLTAYVVEDSLSVDNLFVFLLIFRYFKVAAHAYGSSMHTHTDTGAPCRRSLPPAPCTLPCALHFAPCTLRPARVSQVPPQLVNICLNYGIAGSIVLRGVFIFAGLAAVSPVLTSHPSLVSIERVQRPYGCPYLRILTCLSSSVHLHGYGCSCMLVMLL